MKTEIIRRTYLTFNGNVKQMLWVIGFYGDYTDFVLALERSNWDLEDLKADVLRLQGERGIEQSGIPFEESEDANSESVVNHLRAMERLKVLNTMTLYQTNYTDDDLDLILEYIQNGNSKLTDNDYLLDDVSAKSTDGKVTPKDGMSLTQLLLQNKPIRIAWGKRGSQEFPENDIRYYEQCKVCWKKEAHDRVASPPDKYLLKLKQEIEAFNDFKDPAVKIAKGELSLVRLVAAKATGQDQRFLAEFEKNGGVSGYEYVETQLHKELEWDDVDKIEVGDELTFKIVTELEAFKKEHSYSFTITPDLEED